VNRFNLTFHGEILPGRNPAQVKERFARLFDINEPERVESFFSGEPVVLRRNLERKVAAEYFAKLRKIGIQAELVKVTTDSADASSTAPSPDNATDATTNQQAADIAARQAAAEEARRRAQQETARRQAAEEEAERKAQARRQRAEKAARERAQREQARREAAEQAARDRAERETRKREADEDKRRQQAMDKARRELEQREAAEREARESAEREAAKQAAAAQAAEDNARRAAVRRKAADEQRQREQQARARREKAKRAAAAKAAKKKAAREAAERAAAEQAALDRAAREAEQAAERAAMEEQAIARAARALHEQPAVQATRSGVRSSLAVPRRADARDGLPRRRQPGEPNLYLLQAFRNTQAVRQRASIAEQRKKRSLFLGALALTTLLLLYGAFMGHQPLPLVIGPEAAAADPQYRLTLLAGGKLLLHDRAGVGRSELAVATLGVATLQPPIAYGPDGRLFALARLTDDTEAAVVSCQPEAGGCQLLYRPAPDQQITQLAPHPLNGELFLVDSAGGELLQLDPAGEISARAKLRLPPDPVIRLESGLLFMNSPHGPAISVLRYEASAFGKQLDEVLLLPPEAAAREHNRVTNFVYSGGSWWVTLANSESGSAGLYRFDNQWNYLERVPLAPGFSIGQLLNWGDKTLVLDPGHLDLLRYNASGQVEVPLQSDLLQAMARQQSRQRWLQEAAWRLVLVAVLLAAAASFAHAMLNAVRSLVYRTLPSRGAEPLDNVESIDWVDPVAQREQKMQRLVAGYGVLALAILLLTIGLSANLLQLIAMLILLTGPLAALLLLRRQPIGHVGVYGDQLVLVDQEHRYHHGGGPRLQHRGPFLLVDDVVVFTGNAAWPVFDPQQVKELIAPKARAGIRVDRKTVAVKLLESGHPLARGAALVLATSTTALALLLLQGIF
jgi:hypothetical protein